MAAKAQRRSRIQGSRELSDLWKASHVQDTMLYGMMTVCGGRDREGVGLGEGLGGEEERETVTRM